MARYLGIDPGADGALCLLDSVSHETWFHATPGGDTNCHDVLRWLVTQHEQEPIKIAALESVHAIHRTSAGSNFTFGRNVGMLIGIVEGLGQFGYIEVLPRKWQGALNIPAKVRGKKNENSSAQTKKAVGAAVRKIYPQAEVFGPRGGLLDGRCDALGLAHFAALKY